MHIHYCNSYRISFTKGVIVLKKPSVLELHKTDDGMYQSVFKNNHGRRIYISLYINKNDCKIIDCFYIDRTSRPAPNKFETHKLVIDELLTVIASELDKVFSSYTIVESPKISAENFIAQAMHKEKYNILLMLKDGDTLKTIFKNRFRREIFLEIDLSGPKALIKKCKYCDIRGEDVITTPYNLTTIYFHYDFEALLKIVNNELEGGFTDVMVSEHNTIVLDRPICGSI